MSRNTRNPMIGNLPACCARIVSGHAAAPPTSVMNSRRLMGIASVRGSHPIISSKSRIVHHSILAHPTSATGHFSTEATAPGKRVDVGCWPDSSGPFHRRRFVGQCQKETYAVQRKLPTRSARRQRRIVQLARRGRAPAGPSGRSLTVSLS
jgi:hypothetical protein